MVIAASGEDLRVSEARVLRAIQTYLTDEGIPPTVREICKLSGLSSSCSVHRYFVSLKEKGYITYRPERVRTVALLKSIE